MSATSRRYRRNMARSMMASPPELPVWLADQMGAAAGQLRQMSAQVEMTLEATGQFCRADFGVDAELMADVFAALLRCTMCDHVAGAPQPAMADLSLDRIECLPCAASHDPEGDQATSDRCDLCESRGHSVFRESLLRAGPLWFHLNTASCCWERLGAVSAA